MTGGGTLFSVGMTLSQRKAYNDFIPLCSFAENHSMLKNCTVFKKTTTKIQQHPCFTFNDSSFTPQLGLTRGLNFLVNYDYPGTNNELSKPITIILHEPGLDPDVRNINGKNFKVNPGSIVNLRVSTTILDTTQDFDSMNFEKRNCTSDRRHGEINCINEKIAESAISKCNCVPWYSNDSVAKVCNTVDTICFKEAIENNVENLKLEKSCYPKRS